MSDNLKTWRKMDRPPLSALKKIGGGKLSGKSDITPQWRYQIMTDVFGMCGVGWKYTIDRLWTEKGDAGEVFAFAQVSVYVRDPLAAGCWSDPIPATGGSMLIQTEKGKLYNNDEGFKMCVTDALGTALKMLGVAADIYLGNFDGSKYRERPQEKPQADPKLRDDALAILMPAAKEGRDAFDLAWKTVSKEMRQAVVNDIPEFKRLVEQKEAAANGQ